MVKIISWTHDDKDDPIYCEVFTFTSHSKPKPHTKNEPDTSEPKGNEEDQS